MERHFHEELRQLKEKLLHMSHLVQEAISLAIQALAERDDKLAQQVASSDEAINMLEIEIDEACFKLMALHQPQAGDLRFIAAVLKINNDLERQGDLAVNIAETTRFLIKEPLNKSLENIKEMAKVAQGMLSDSLTAFVNKDSKLAREICVRDDIVDDLNDKILMEFLNSSTLDQKAKARGVDLILVSRNLERIADHSTNICEDVIYMVEGKTIKHHIDERQPS